MAGDGSCAEVDATCHTTSRITGRTSPPVIRTQRRERNGVRATVPPPPAPAETTGSAAGRGRSPATEVVVSPSPGPPTTIRGPSPSGAFWYDMAGSASDGAGVGLLGER